MTDASRNCRRPRCRGQGRGVYDEDGYCDHCGFHIDDPFDEVPPPMPSPSAAPWPGPVFIDPVLPESQRRCRNKHDVGFTSDGRSGPLKGACEECDEPYDFTNNLVRGDVVAGQYEVKGCIAHGGFGGIYLAHDRNLDHDVILKGLLDPIDPEAEALVEAERRYLVTVKHPNIVDIHNSVKHRFPDGAEYDYLVMDYVKGYTLSEPRHPARLGRRGEIPPIVAVHFALQILDAFAYMHEFGLVYCDLKPTNIIQMDDRLTIIDLGAVRRIDRDGSPVYGTTGYQAPEIAEGHSPDVISDLRTVGRTLAVLTLGFDAAERVDGESREKPLPKRPVGFNESLYLFLERSCSEDRDVRFTSAEDMADQLRGVLRQLRAEADGDPTPLPSNRFGLDRGAFASTLANSTASVFAPARAREARALLPVPMANRADTAYPALTALATQSAARAIELARALQPTEEVRLAVLRMSIELEAPEAERLLDEAAGQMSADWRLDWYRGIHALGRETAEAAAHFEKVRRHLPGELAPMLALAICDELTGVETSSPDRLRQAAKHYGQVWRTDRNLPSAAFGLARCSTDPVERLDTLEAVPAASSQYRNAQQALIAERIRRAPTKDAIVKAGANLDNLEGLDSFQADLIEAELWRAALAVIGPEQEEPDLRIRGVPLTRNDMSLAYEAVLRRVGSYCASPLARWALVTEANRNRPRTWL